MDQFSETDARSREAESIRQNMRIPGRNADAMRRQTQQGVSGQPFYCSTCTTVWGDSGHSFNADSVKNCPNCESLFPDTDSLKRELERRSVDLTACREVLAKIIGYVDMPQESVSDLERESYVTTGGNVGYWEAITEQARALLARLDATH